MHGSENLGTGLTCVKINFLYFPDANLVAVILLKYFLQVQRLILNSSVI